MATNDSDRDYIRLIELSPIAAILTDPNLADNPIVAANAAFERLTGYSSTEIAGRNCRFLQGPLTEPDTKARLREAVETATPLVIEMTNYRKDGSSFRNAVMLAPIKDRNGRLRFFMGSQMAIDAGALADRRAQAQALIATLSRRQLQVLTHMAQGLRHAEIANVLGIAEKTVKMHRAALVERLGCRTSAEAIRLAVEGGR